ncbi:hypothetical protein HUO13_14250 [Saccharopolyspora erythraea]|nr:hypothetical protein HUO13_14250 [Saccharopolyspora erythraea]
MPARDGLTLTSLENLAQRCSTPAEVSPPGSTPAKVVCAFLANLVGNGAAVVISPIAGAIADELGRKRPVLMTAGILVVVGIAIIISAASLIGFLISMARTHS